ncbi:hypothetical protein SAMN04488095_0928 [Jannaschia pohangensis]|uniref:Uncharacterized protein n=1 Tax=Jannaschia pohangensis TaxID=390807 RepID=A0A1I3IDY5_9RHOB|nr:hypothetical protein SAMN04488095_0928 [Jannaschia pohangensis]
MPRRGIDLGPAANTSRRTRIMSMAIWLTLCATAAVVVAAMVSPFAGVNTFLIAGVILPGGVFLISNL